MAIIRKPVSPKAPERPEAFEKLLPTKWRTTDFPASSVTLSFEQDLVEHKYVGVDGASVEATGRGAMKITVKIPFVNGIVPGKGEHWDAGDLYPTAFRAFLIDFANNSLGDLSHPELGVVRCRPHSFETEHDPMRRDGVIVTATWIESTEDVTGDANLLNNLPEIQANRAALNLDASAADVLSLAPDYPQFSDTFDTALNKITGVIDKVTITASLAANKPAQMLHRLKQVDNSIARAGTALTWPVSDSSEQLKSAMFDIENHLTKAARPVLRYTTRSRATLASLTSVTGSSVDDLIKLNPQLLARPEVPSGTVIRYYASKVQ